MQKKIIRIIGNVPFGTHTNPLFHDLKLLKFEDIVRYQQYVFMYKCIYKYLPEQFCTLFDYNYNIHNYPTRSVRDIHIPRHRTIAFQQNIRYSGPKLWNDLNEITKTCSSIRTFTRYIKNVYFEQYKQ